ncbi:MAG: hypothetical protein Q8M16_11080 [Pirellulaceae bacterium]|nr:hypothetical protein [Pirellulaceae bacterium]
MKSTGIAVFFVAGLAICWFAFPGTNAESLVHRPATETARLRPTAGLPTQEIDELAAKTQQWPGFRSDGSSTLRACRFPLQWSPSQGIAWRKEIPGYGAPKNGFTAVIQTGDEFNLLATNQLWDYGEMTEAADAAAALREKNSVPADLQKPKSGPELQLGQMPEARNRAIAQVTAAFFSQAEISQKRFFCRRQLEKQQKSYSRNRLVLARAFC